MSLQYCLVLLVCCLPYSLSEEEVIKGVSQSENGNFGSIKFKTPELDDEDAYSQHMPSSLKCDGCRIISHLIVTSFDNIHNNRPSLKNKRLPEYEVLDILESTCQTKSFENCGVKDIKGVKRLSGPGLDIVDVPGIMQGGGKWPGRLHEMCLSYLGELGEEEIYDEYKKNGKKLEQFLCYGSDVQGECSNINKSKKKKEEL